MNKLASGADLRSVTSSNGDGDDRGSAIGRRFEALGISDRDWHATTGIDRKTLRRAIANGSNASTYTAIEAWLDKLEARNAGAPVAIPAQAKSSEDLIEFDISGDFGVHVVVKGPVRDADVLRRQAAELIREIRGQGNGED
jgi:hypothetical protein